MYGFPGVSRDLRTTLHFNVLTLYRYFVSFLSSDLLNLFSEIQCWDRLKFEIPQSVSDIYQDRDDLRGLRQQVLLLVREYNRSDLERSLAALHSITIHLESLTSFCVVNTSCELTAL